MKKKEGFVEFTVALFVIFMIAIMIKFTMDFREMRLVDEYLDDALASAVLASAVVDLDEYGRSRDIVIGKNHQKLSEGSTPVNGFHVAYNNFIEGFAVSLGATVNTNDSRVLEYARSNVINNIRVDRFEVYNYKNGIGYSRLYIMDPNNRTWDKSRLSESPTVDVMPHGTPYAMSTVYDSSESLYEGGVPIGTTIYVKLVYDLALPNGISLGTTGSREYKVSVYETEVTP